MSPVISIIVPVYKTEKQLRRCIDSILAQTFKEFELILIDDGSPDGCPAICDEYAEKDNRISVIHKENEGLAEVRNVGVRAAKGQYIGFVDSDDYIEPDMYERLYTELKENGADLAICSFNKVTCENGKETKYPVTFNVKEKFCDSDSLTRLLLSSQSALAAIAWNKLYNKSLFDGVRYPKGKIHEDEAAAHIIAYNTKKAVIIPDHLYNYTVNTESIINSPFSRKNFDALYFCTERLGFYKSHKEKEYLSLAQNAYWYTINKLLQRSVSPDETIAKELKVMKKQFNKFFLSIIFGNAFSIKEKSVITLYFISPKLYVKKILNRKGSAKKAE